MSELMSANDLMKLDRIRTGNPYSLSVEELATRQIAINSRRVSGGIAFARKIHRSEKNIARGRVVSLFKKARWERGLGILTMPGIDWTFEARLLSAREGGWQNRTRPARSTHITAVELDPAIYAAACLSMPRTAKAPIVTYLKSPMWTAHSTGSDAIGRFHNCDVFNLMERGTKQFDAAWLDFTGPLSPERMERISAFYREFIASTLVVTFLGARHNQATTVDVEESDGVRNLAARRIARSRRGLLALSGWRLADGAVRRPQAAGITPMPASPLPFSWTLHAAAVDAEHADLMNHDRP